MIQLTQEQGQELRAGEAPPRAFDPCTSTIYVLVPTDVYGRAKLLFSSEDDDFARALHSQAMEAFGRDGWNDPAMDIYNDLDPTRR